ncbi:MAG: hypothetical protein M1820_006666 [Bogoriella megaspora]|nr:MAG: hypothetical protein M1820_006666 [Bogoriella megaspora]
MRLQHLSLPGLTSYHHAAALQDRLVNALLRYKALRNLSYPPPDPTILTAEFHPVYTCGRREINTISPSQQAYLRANNRAEFVEALRGGQTTFHGPGQLVAYPILDLKRHGLSPRNYVCALEGAVIRTLARFGVNGMRTQHPGVWVSEESKIAAVGVHLRRNVTSHGIGLNVGTDLWWFERIVACGLEGKRTTSLEKQRVDGKTVAEVARVFVEEMARDLGVDEVEVVGEDEVVKSTQE